MLARSDIGILKLRGHHICCSPLLTIDLSERGTKFLQVKDKIRQTLRSGIDSTVMVIEGVDELCKECPLCKGDRCESPQGNEEQVRKWDAILLKELGLSFGEALKVRELQSLLKKKSPFRLCQRCRWRGSCSVGSTRAG
jgi:hypothetical protein